MKLVKTSAQIIKGLMLNKENVRDLIEQKNLLTSICWVMKWSSAENMQQRTQVSQTADATRKLKVELHCVEALTNMFRSIEPLNEEDKDEFSQRILHEFINGSF